MPKATNEKSIYEVPNDESDGSTFELPDTDGSGETDPDGDSLENNGGEGYDIRGKDAALVKVVNGWNENVDVTLRGSTFDDAGMDDPADDQSTKTINAGETDYMSESEHWAFLDVEVEPNNDPTDGTLKVVFQSDSYGP